MDATPKPAAAPSTSRYHPFRSAVLRGLAILMPPLLTLVLFIWAWSVIERYVLVPVEAVSKEVIVFCTVKSLDEPPEDLVGGMLEDEELVSFNSDNRQFKKSTRNDWFGRYRKGESVFTARILSSASI
jgi:hypothetical protein